MMYALPLCLLLLAPLPERPWMETAQQLQRQFDNIGKQLAQLDAGEKTPEQLQKELADYEELLAKLKAKQKPTAPPEDAGTKTAPPGKSGDAGAVTPPKTGIDDGQPNIAGSDAVPSSPFLQAPQDRGRFHCLPGPHLLVQV